MMTISESQYSSNKMSSIHKINDRVVHRDSFGDVQQSSSVNSTLVTKRGFKPSDMFDPQKKEFLTNLSYKLFPVSWVSRLDHHFKAASNESFMECHKDVP
ncbi:hypothetical protein EVAR_29162_1 [Eumeta japonica]|uniref:Uncharacterized protein n=1 Tax=Eumeta variegata TaxID=151549 RepID=A0A4C1VCK5_EUMVA|nr:hypothetical protein EVAR_29162_1 [Eumeta japonica]